MSPELMIAALAGLALFGGLGALLAPRLAGADPFQDRLQRIARSGDQKSANGAEKSGPTGKSVKDVLNEIEEAQRRRRRLTLHLRLRQAGLSWTKPFYFAVSAGIGLGVFLLALAPGLSTVIALGFGIGAGVGLPMFYLRLLRRRRLKRMGEEFPNAIDVIVRGVKSGLPFPDCLRIIANEAQEPLKGEFAKIVRDQAVGLPIDQAIDRFAQRVPLPEANFFAIVIAIQSRTGGSLSESLQNLANVLRERRKMRGKIKAMSAEAKASGGIIASLPILVSIIIYFTSPDYMALLFETLTGNLVIAASAVWMTIGVFVMQRMINFDF